MPDCYQIFPKAGANRARTEQIQEIEFVAISRLANRFSNSTSLPGWRCAQFWFACEVTGAAKLALLLRGVASLFAVLAVLAFWVGGRARIC